MKDFLGREVNPGDYFAYPLIVGRSASMALYRMAAIVESTDHRDKPILKVKANKITESYGNDGWKYHIWERPVDEGKSGWRDMTDAEKAKVDAKTSTLTMFSERACKVEYSPNE